MWFLILGLLAIVFLSILYSHTQTQTEKFVGNDSKGLETTPPNPDVNASPVSNSQTAQGERVQLASAPGVMPGGAEISKGSTAFITNTPSSYTQQFAQATIVTNDQANSAYKDILQYLAQNPQKSTDFLNDIRKKFFDDKALFKTDINFKGLASQPNMVFNS